MKYFSSFFAVSAVLWPSVFATNGDIACSNSMCVTAIVHSNSTTTYDLTVENSQVGWMAIGFGRTMINTPMVILWRDSSNGNAIISQRAASAYSMPTVVSSPPRVATAVNSRANFNSSALTLSFSVPSNSDVRQSIIYAWSRNAPSSNSVDATIVQHDENGNLNLNLANQLPSSFDEPGSNSTTTTPTPGSNTGSTSVPLTSSQRMFAAHAILMTVAFLIILPLGALQARLLRTIVPGKFWFAAHWVLQWPVAGLLIIVGLSLGATEKNKLKLPNSQHTTIGITLLVLYAVQCIYGGVIHFIKPARSTGRPIQNYGHAILGLTIIALSFKQVHSGLNDEWPRIGGPEVPMSIWTWWKVWVIMIPLLYLFGLALLRRQYRLEREPRAKAAETSAVGPKGPQ